ncbi:hypothetical protein FHU38_002469 [Saccharomonospora amisosensis]|uniref:Uncharacterized protein n=1 Tax=Saccharomonospora amisosensis TaxID=1128677 RepID=A0A7X5UQ61_9PSEU|nr:hypothetical protein [Saccharomonospora amisosensis]
MTKAVIAFTVEDGRITRIAVDTDPDRLHTLDVILLPSTRKSRDEQ